jgi:hypothetical protein
VHGSVGIASCADTCDRTAGSLLPQRRPRDVPWPRRRARTGWSPTPTAWPRRPAAAQDLAQDLAGAAAADQLTVHYQPTVRLTDGRTTGFEALVRWNHPGRGPGAARRVHPARRGDRCDHRHRALGAPRGAPSGRRVDGLDRRAAAHGREPLAAPVPGRRRRRRCDRGPRGERLARRAS